MTSKQPHFTVLTIVNNPVDNFKVLNLYLALEIDSEYIFFVNETVLCLVSQKHITTTQSSVVRRWFLLETVKLTQTVITDFNFN